MIDDRVSDTFLKSGCPFCRPELEQGCGHWLGTFFVGLSTPSHRWLADEVQRLERYVQDCLVSGQCSSDMSLYHIYPLGAQPKAALRTPEALDALSGDKDLLDVFLQEILCLAGATEILCSEREDGLRITSGYLSKFFADDAARVAPTARMILEFNHEASPKVAANEAAFAESSRSEVN